MSLWFIHLANNSKQMEKRVAVSTRFALTFVDNTTAVMILGYQKAATIKKGVGKMGDEIKLLGVLVIQGGVLQIDFYNETEKKGYRCFCDAKVFFEKLGYAMEVNHIEWQEKFAKELIDGKQDITQG